MSEHLLNYIVLGLAVLSLVFVVAEIALKDPTAFREIATDVARMARSTPAGPARSAEIHQLRTRRNGAVETDRKAA